MLNFLVHLIFYKFWYFYKHFYLKKKHSLKPSYFIKLFAFFSEKSFLHRIYSFFFLRAPAGGQIKKTFILPR